METTDEDLLRQYIQGSQDAFAELVSRHLDLVYSAARRQVPASHLAEEVTQSVFISLSRGAATLKPGTPLAAWLHLATRHAAINATRRESRRQAREQAAMEISAMNSTPSVWSQVEPLLDEAVAALPELDRNAVLLRYFENQSLRQVGQFLGASEDAAQKRVSRAVDQLRAFFLKRGVLVTPAGLVTNLSAHAIQTAPAALHSSISTLATFGTVAAQTAVMEAGKTLSMTALQKTLAAGVLVCLAGGALFETSQLLRQRTDLAVWQQRERDLAMQIRQAEERSALTPPIGEARRISAVTSDSSPAPLSATDASIEAAIKTLAARVDGAKRLAAEQPALTIPEFELLTEQDWFSAARRMKADSNDELPQILRDLRNAAKVRLSSRLGSAMASYVKAHQGLLPSDPRELVSYFTDLTTFANPPNEAMLQRYVMLYSGAAANVPADARNRILVEATSPDEERDQRIGVGVNSSAIHDFRDLSSDTRYALRAFSQANSGAAPIEAGQLLPYFKPALSPARQQKFLQSGLDLPRP